MSRTVYLIRHAMPDIPLGERWCVGGLCDLPLGRLGRVQAARLPFVPALQNVTMVFCSTLSRAIDTAKPLCADPVVIPGLEEQRMGVWDGLPFTEIRQRWPELYAAREKDPSLLPEGAEAISAVEERMRKAVHCCLDRSEGDIAIVSHKSSIASLVGHRSALSYTSLSVLREENGRLQPVKACIPPHVRLSDALCLAMLRASGADDGRVAHCIAVAETADALCVAMNKAGLSLDPEAVHYAGLLHDLAKGEPEHAAVGGLWLSEMGYPLLADIVRQHTEPDGDSLNEAGLVFLADKLVRGDQRVTIAERFEASFLKCTTPEARAAHRRRWQLAASIQEQTERLIGDIKIG